MKKTPAVNILTFVTILSLSDRTKPGKISIKKVVQLEHKIKINKSLGMAGKLSYPFKKQINKSWETFAEYGAWKEENIPADQA